MRIEFFDVNKWRQNHLPPPYFAEWHAWFHLGFHDLARELGDAMATLNDLAAKESAVLAAVQALVGKVTDLEAQVTDLTAQVAAAQPGVLTADEQATVDATDAGLQSALDTANAALNPPAV